MKFTIEQLQIIRYGLGLQWSSYVKQLDVASDPQHCSYLCRQIVETVMLYKRIDEVLENEV